MNKIAISFEGVSWFDISSQMYAALGLDRPAAPSIAGEARLQTIGEIYAEQGEAQAPPTEPEPAAPPVAPAKRSHKKANSSAAPAPASAPEAAPEPLSVVDLKIPAGPPGQPEAEREIPALDVLKSAVTRAVRAAQKKEPGASPKILDLLPDFKRKTGLDFVMSAEDKHREALFDLIEAAGLEIA
jgi:hypothetical protein